MIHQRIENLNIVEESPLVTPGRLKADFPLEEQDILQVLNGQETVKRILKQEDPRLMIVTGPCSIHDPKAALEYADRLVQLQAAVEDSIFLVMRTYFEKPRTKVGWQGLVIDPHMNESYQVEEGLKIARKLLLEITRKGLPVAGEALDIVTPPYLQDLISYTAIGARTVESQSHRKMASGLTSAVGFKNATWGDVDAAIHAVASARNPHHFISINPAGQASVIRTKGNAFGHLILRGGKKPNYEARDLDHCINKMKEAGLPLQLVIDCSHGNSGKQAENQARVFHSLVAQIKAGNQAIRGIMLESHLKPGKQKLGQDLKQLEYGVSITDACIGWKETETLIRSAHEALKH